MENDFKWVKCYINYSSDNDDDYDDNYSCDDKYDDNEPIYSVVSDHYNPGNILGTVEQELHY